MALGSMPMPHIPAVRIYVNNVWDRQEWETDAQFEAFRLFRNMSYRRTIVRVAKRLDKQDSLLHRWSTANEWRKRVADYDAEIDAIEQARHRKRVAKMADDHATLARALFAKVAKRVRELNVDELAPKDLVRWLDVAVRIERTSRGATNALRPDIALPKPPGSPASA